MQIKNVTGMVTVMKGRRKRKIYRAVACKKRTFKGIVILQVKKCTPKEKEILRISLKNGMQKIDLFRVFFTMIHSCKNAIR